MKTNHKEKRAALVISVIFGVAIALILAAVLLADSLIDRPGGVVAMFVMVVAGGVLISLGNFLDEWRRRRWR